MRKIALLLVGLSTAALVSIAPAPANAASTTYSPAFDTNWPCHGC
jgi:hypothetical protein